MRIRDVALMLILEILACGCLRGSDGHPLVHDGTHREPRRTFFVRPDGDDAASGEALDQAWRSIERVNQQDLEPGDGVLFEAGARFEGTLVLDADDAGADDAPVVIGSFGAGVATLDGGNGSGITVTDAGGIVIQRLRLVGGWDAQKQSGNDGEGVSATGDESGVRWSFLRIADLEISGFERAGIALHAAPADDRKGSGFDDVEISGCDVHDNGDVGVTSDGPFTLDGGYSHAHVRVVAVRVYDNRGLMHKGSHTGSGIMLSDVDDALVEGSIAHDNGEYNDHEQGGSFGIWAWDAHAVTLQWNESYRNRTQTVDGGGFDLDGGVTDSVVRYNYSHDNAGAGFGAFQFAGARPYANNVIEYNISQDDGDGVYLYDGNGDMGALAVAQNVTYGGATGFRTVSAVPQATVFNNIFYNIGDVTIDVSDGDGLTLDGNDYWPVDHALALHWNAGTTFDSLEAFQRETSQEPHGLNVDPQLVAAGTGGTLDDAQLLGSLFMYQLDADSELVDRGVDPNDLGVTLTDRDFYGDQAPQGSARDIGVHELR
jgi:hypothetical protein